MKLLRLVLSSSALAFLAGCFLCLTTASAVHVKGYTKKNGTYVTPHERSSPNHTKNDNYSTKGNVNPYTGKEGAKPRDAEPAATTAAVPIVQTPRDEERVVIIIPPSAAPVVAPLKPGTFADLKGGMSEADLKLVLGTPSEVEGKPNYEVWTYPAGTVFLSPKAGVIAWKENKWTVTTSAKDKPKTKLHEH